MTLEQKVKYLEDRIALLETRLGLGTDDAALDDAISQILERRDSSALDAYLKRGGKIPTVVPASEPESRNKRISA